MVQKRRESSESEQRDAERFIPPAPPENEPAPRPPRAPFCVYVVSAFSMPKCQLCGAKPTTKRPGRHSRFPGQASIYAVGPFKICDECVAELDRALCHEGG